MQMSNLAQRTRAPTDERVALSTTQDRDPLFARVYRSARGCRNKARHPAELLAGPRGCIVETAPATA